MLGATLPQRGRVGQVGAKEGGVSMAQLIGVGTRSWWDHAVAWSPLVLVVLVHVSGALARFAVPS